MSFSRGLAILLLFSIPVAKAQSLVSDADIIFTTIDVPGAGYTGVTAINTAGDVVGVYGQSINTDSNGFLYQDGLFTYFDYPDQIVTVPLGINDSGVVVGHAGQNPVVGFLYDGAAFTTIRAGNRSATFASGINNAGDVVGGAGTIYTTKGFEMHNGLFKMIDFPGQYTYGMATGINNFGKVVGWTSTPDHGYAYRNGKFQAIEFPGADNTTVSGVNDNGIVVGWYTAGVTARAFAMKNGKYISFSYPGAKFTGASGINNLGQIVGEYDLGDNIDHGFVTSPVTISAFEKVAPHKPPPIKIPDKRSPIDRTWGKMSCSSLTGVF